MNNFKYFGIYAEEYPDADLDGINAVVNAVRADIAEEIRRELVCCAPYERHNGPGFLNGPSHHSICYWGEAAAKIAEGSGEVE